MSALDLLRQLDAEATDGPWTAHGDDHIGWLSGPPTGYDGEYETPPDAHLIATLRTLLPELIAVVREMDLLVDYKEVRGSNALDALNAKAAAL